VIFALVAALAASNDDLSRRTDVEAVLVRGIQSHGEIMNVCGELRETNGIQRLSQYSGYHDLEYYYIEIDYRLKKSETNDGTCVTGKLVRRDGLSKKEVLRRWYHIAYADVPTLGFKPNQQLDSAGWW
jgi:hypothetical protein